MINSMAARNKLEQKSGQLCIESYSAHTLSHRDCSKKLPQLIVKSKIAILVFVHLCTLWVHNLDGRQKNFTGEMRTENFKLA